MEGEQTLFDPKIISEMFNDFFINVIHDIGTDNNIQTDGLIVF